MTDPRRTRLRRDAVSSRDVEAIRIAFESSVMPAAKRLRLCDPDAKLMDFAGRETDGHSVIFKLTAPKRDAERRARNKAADELRLVAFMVGFLCEGEKTRPADPGLPSAIALVRSQLDHLAGYLEAIADMGTETSLRGARARRTFGDESRERVRVAVQCLRGPMSKESAADKIAPIVGKAKGTVLRMLIEQFPGDAWPHGRRDASTDPS